MSARPYLIALLWLIGIPAVKAETSARVVETYPVTDATLGRQQNFWVRIEFETDTPVSLWARPYRDGVRIEQIYSNASVTHTGAGEALGWFSLIHPGEVDEVRIVAGGGNPYREWEVARETVRLRWSGSSATTDPHPPWVDSLLAAEQAQRKEFTRQQASQPVSAGETTMFTGFMLGVVVLIIAAIAVPLRSAWMWRGGWRWAAAVPAALMSFVVLRILVDTARDPTSHNLWPFEIVMFGVPSLLIIAALAFVRRVRRIAA